VNIYSLDLHLTAGMKLLERNNERLATFGESETRGRVSDPVRLCRDNGYVAVIDSFACNLLSRTRIELIVTFDSDSS